METEFSPKILLRKIERLSAWKKLAFALSICERLYPNFVLFSKEVGIEGQEILRNCLDDAWKKLKANQLNISLSSIADRCMAIAPDTEDYQTILVSSALDAASSVSYLMTYLSKADIKLIVEIASLARDSVDMYVQEIEGINPYDPALEKKILEHPLMQAELRRQRHAIEFLSNLNEDLNVSFSEVSNNWLNTRTSNLGLNI